MPIQKLVWSCVLTVVIAASTVATAEISEERKTPALELLTQNEVDHEDKYVVTRFVAYKKGGDFISAQHPRQGLLVFDSELTFHIDEDDKLIRGIDGSANFVGSTQVLDDLIIDPDSLISKQQASEIFSREAKELTIPNISGQGPGTKASGPKCTQNHEQIEFELGIYKLRPAWRAKCRKRYWPVMYIDAVDGSVLSFDSGVRS